MHSFCSIFRYLASISDAHFSPSSCSLLEVICKDVNQLQIQKKYSDVFLAMDRLFDSSQEEAQDWPNVERLHMATRARNDVLFGTDLKMPQGSYTPSEMVTPRVFGDAFMYVPFLSLLHPRIVIEDFSAP